VTYRRAALFIATVALVAGAACGSSDPTEEPPLIGEDQTVVAFDGEHIYFGGENRRSVDINVTFPDDGALYDSVRLSIALRCPNDRCDWWDRLGWLSLVQNPGAEDETEIELSRFITPYRVGTSWDLEVGDLITVLRGDVVLRVFIDTWVGPGHSNGEGWLVDASFEFRGGVPTAEAYRVIPLWSPSRIVYGDPLRPTLRAATADIEDTMRAARLRTFVTGHGQGSADNCAEFCPREHFFDVGPGRYAQDIWRDDCETTAAPGQQGTWQYPRAGWCPGAKVHGWFADVTQDVMTNSTLSVSYDVEAYVNTCRPDATDCAGCVAGSCEYNDGSHTEPGYYMSSALILYR